MNRWMFRILLLFSLFLASACGRTGAAQNPVVDGFVAALQAKDVDQVLSYYSDGFVYLNVTILDWGEVPLTDYQRVLRQGYAADDGIFIPEKTYYAEDSSGAALSGSFTAMDKNGKLAIVPMVMIIEIEGGKITRQTDYFDGRRFIK
jgi:ketosteroid isomerase-like protein